jgi:hypothetical protein
MAQRLETVDQYKASLVKKDRMLDGQLAQQLEMAKALDEATARLKEREIQVAQAKGELVEERADLAHREADVANMEGVLKKRDAKMLDRENKLKQKEDALDQQVREFDRRIREAAQKATEDLEAQQRAGARRIAVWAEEADTTLVPLGVSPIRAGPVESLSNALPVLDTAFEWLRHLDQVLSARLEAEG